MRISQYIRDLGYNLIQIWECEYKLFRRTNTITNKYLYPTEEKYRLSKDKILESIKAGEIFGCVEVDLYVPNKLKSYFEEMTPIFKHFTVKLQDIGAHMQHFVEKHKKSFKSRQYLIGSMFATKILIITPLLCWYMEHGVKVDKVYQLIQFLPKKCFEKFASKISDDRRLGDRHPDFRVIADTSKLIGELNVIIYVTQ